jgi:hypothetical protein
MALPGLNLSNALSAADRDAVCEVIVQNRLTRILDFLGLSIHDIINDPIARNRVACYFRLDRWLERQREIGELEAQWTGWDTFHRG